jgi:hypothetical protein
MEGGGSDHCDRMERMSRLRPFSILVSEYLETHDVLITSGANQFSTETTHSQFVQ